MRDTMSDAANGAASRVIPTAPRRKTSEAAEAISLVLSFALIAGFIATHWNSGLLELRFMVPAAGVVAGVFALFGFAVRGVTLTGAVAGFAVTFILWTLDGWSSFAVLFTVFALTWIATRLGRARKQRLGIAERRAGRTGLQVLANVGLAAGFCIFLPPFHPWWLCS